MIEQTIRQKLPKGFQRAEFLEEHGFVDAIVKREEQRSVLTQILKLHGYGETEKTAQFSKSGLGTGRSGQEL